MNKRLVEEKIKNKFGVRIKDEKNLNKYSAKFLKYEIEEEKKQEEDELFNPKSEPVLISESEYQRKISERMIEIMDQFVFDVPKIQNETGKIKELIEKKKRKIHRIS